MKTLVGAEWTLVLRDRRAFLAGIALVFLVTLVPHMAHHWLVDLSGLGSRSLEALDSPVIDESVAVSGAVGWAVEGPRPPWLAEAAGSGAPPEALVRFWTEDGGQSGVHFDVLGLFPGARLDAVADAVKEAGFQERQKRAEAVGLVGPWKEVLDLEFLEPPVAPVPFRWPKVPLGAALVLLAGAMASLSWIMDTVPRARTGGWLESLAVLPLGRVRVDVPGPR